MTRTTTSGRIRDAIVVALASTVLAACGGDTPPPPEGDDTTAGTEIDDTADETEADDSSGEEDTDTSEPAALPASGELDGRRVTVVSMGPTTLSFDEPDEGMEVIYLEVLVENVSAEPWNSNIVQFFLVDGDGNEIGPELLGSEAGDPLPDVDPLEQGESSTGFIPYQVPPGSSLTLVYAVDLSTGKTIDIPLR